MPAPLPPDPSPPSAIPWPPLLLAGAIGGAIVLGRVAPLPWPGEGDLAARIVGLAIGGAGIALLIWSVATLWQAGTTVRPDRAVRRLVVEGPYRLRRNPIYLADVLIMLGLAEITRNVWLVLAVIPFALLVTWLSILPEEHHLEARFGEEWRAYRDRVRRWI